MKGRIKEHNNTYFWILFGLCTQHLNQNINTQRKTSRPSKKEVYRKRNSVAGKARKRKEVELGVLCARGKVNDEYGRVPGWCWLFEQSDDDDNTWQEDESRRAQVYSFCLASSFSRVHSAHTQTQLLANILLLCCGEKVGIIPLYRRYTRLSS